MKKRMNSIGEIIVVEGRDDTAAVKRAVDAETIETHGFGISRQTWEEIEKAQKSRGLIVFTDPDHAGEEIRRRIKEKYPDVKEAFLTRDDATKNGDIGIENATPEAIKRALEKARATMMETEDRFVMADLRERGLAGGAGSAEKRRKVAGILGIGYGNSGRFLEKLNSFGITKEELDGAIRSAGDQSHKE